MLGIVIAIATGYYMLRCVGALGAHKGTQRLSNMLNRFCTCFTTQGEYDGYVTQLGHGLIAYLYICILIYNCILRTTVSMLIAAPNSLYVFPIPL